jgi:hypothetical protein
MNVKVIDYNLIDTQTVSAITGLSGETLKNWRHRKIGPPFQKLGSRCLYRDDLLHKWIEKCGVNTCEV